MDKKTRMQQEQNELLKELVTGIKDVLAGRVKDFK
jgi:hypothetical protein